MITRTHNGYHLGDNIVHLNFLRKVAISNPGRKFVHAAQWQYLRELRDVISDVPNISLDEFGYRTPSDSINSWRGDNQFWYSHPDRLDFVKFHVDAWFPYLADRMGVDNPIKTRKDMLFDYPAIQNPPSDVTPDCDVLVINSAPGSGQFNGYNQYELGRIAMAIQQKGFAVAVTDEHPDSLVSTQRLGYSVSQIGWMSLYCSVILMVSTGPSWPTFNIWNQDTVSQRIILIDSERIDLSPYTVHCSKISEAEAILKESGLL